MDVVKPVDSADALSLARPLTPKQSLSNPQGNEPSTFARMLKKSQSSNTTSASSPSRLEERNPHPAERNSNPAVQGSAPKDIQPPPNSEASAEASADVPEVDHEDIAAVPAEFTPNSERANTALNLLADLGGNPDEIGFEQVPPGDPNITEPTLSQIDSESFPIAQTPIESLQNAEPIWAEEFPQLETPDGTVLETHSPLFTLEIELSPEELTTPDEIQNPVAISLAPNSGGQSGIPSTPGNPNRLQGVSSILPANPPVGMVNLPSAQSLLEAHLSADQAGVVSGEGLAPASVPEPFEVTISQTEAIGDGPDHVSTQSGQSPLTHSTNERSGPSVLGANALNLEQSSSDRAEAITDRIARSIVQAAGGGQVLRMRMHPPELGVLQIEVTSLEGNVVARLDVENARAHRAILENLPQLHEMLSRTHAQIDRIELNILENHAEPEGQARQFGQSPNDPDSQEQSLSPGGLILNEEADSRADHDSLGKLRQTEDWRSRSLPLSGIDIQV